MSQQIALLRGINVGGHRKVPMVELQEIAVRLGFKNVQTYIQSGNLLFSTEVEPLKAEQKLEREIAKHFGFTVDVIVRTEKQWQSYLKKFPFADAMEERPQLLMLGLSKLPIDPGAEKLLQVKAAAQERVKVIGNALWIDFSHGSGKSKLSPTVLDKAVGSPTTLRNWKTVLKLATLSQV